jgi:hypothetical protein
MARAAPTEDSPRRLLHAAHLRPLRRPSVRYPQSKAVTCLQDTAFLMHKLVVEGPKASNLSTASI